MIFKGDGSLDKLFSRLQERLNVLLTTHMSGYLMEPIRDNVDFKGAVRTCKSGQKDQKGPTTTKGVISNGDGSLNTFFSTS